MSENLSPDAEDALAAAGRSLRNNQLSEFVQLASQAARLAYWHVTSDRLDGVAPVPFGLAVAISQQAFAFTWNEAKNS